MPTPEENSRWEHDVGDRTVPVRVLGVLSDYVVARYAGCVPYVVHLSDWFSHYRERPLYKRVRFQHPRQIDEGAGG